MATRRGYSTLPNREAVARIRPGGPVPLGGSRFPHHPGPLELVPVDNKPRKPKDTGSDQTFSEAFAKARKEQGGPGGVFEWGGKKYTTEYKEEKAKRERQGLTWKQAYVDKVEPKAKPPIPGLGTPDPERFPATASKPTTPTTVKPRDPQTGSPGGIGLDDWVAGGVGALLGAGAMYLGRKLRSPSLTRKGREWMRSSAPAARRALPSGQVPRALPSGQVTSRLPAWAGGRAVTTRPDILPHPSTPGVIRVRPATQHPATPEVISLGQNVKPPRRRTRTRPKAAAKPKTKAPEKPAAKPKTKAPEKPAAKPKKKTTRKKASSRKPKKESEPARRPTKREQEKAQIEDHVRKHGVTRVPPQEAAPQDDDYLERLIDEADEELRQRGMSIWDIEDL